VGLERRLGHVSSSGVEIPRRDEVGVRNNTSPAVIEEIVDRVILLAAAPPLPRTPIIAG
jgi:hypothetical protein